MSRSRFSAWLSFWHRVLGMAQRPRPAARREPVATQQAPSRRRSVRAGALAPDPAAVAAPRGPARDASPRRTDRAPQGGGAVAPTRAPIGRLPAPVPTLAPPSTPASDRRTPAPDRTVLTEAVGQPPPAPASGLPASRAKSTQPQRTIEQVRADLARLREVTRARQTQAHLERDTNFAPTDFLEPLAQPLPSPRAGDDDFAPTEYRPFLGVLP